MIKTVSENTDTLKKTNTAGECLAQVHSYRQLFDTTSALLVNFFDVEQQQIYAVAHVVGARIEDNQTALKPISLTRDRKQLLLNLPVDVDQSDFMQGKFIRPDGAIIDLVDEIAVLRSLNRMLNNSVRRVHAIEMISLAESRYRKLFSSTIDGIFRTTPQGQVEEANPALAELFGYASPEEVVRNITDIGQQGYAEPETRDAIMRRIKKVGYLTDFEVEFKRKDGTVFPCSMSAQVVKDRRGEIVAFEGRIVNIEDRKLRERAERKREIAEAASQAQAKLVNELKQNRKQLQHSLEEKEILLREVFHRTKNNMLVIISMLRLQLQSVKDPETQSIFIDTENRIRAMALVHQNLYRSENLSDIDLGDYLAEMVTTLVDNMVLEQRVRLVINTQPVAISIDYAVPLGLAVNEIVTNAVKHGFPDNRKGKISLDLCLKDDRNIVLTINDDGVGLPKDFNLEVLKSFGMLMTHNIITKQLQGNFTLHSDNGTVATLSFTEPQRLQRVSL